MDNDTKKRFKRKMYNAATEIRGLEVFIQVHNEQDDSKQARRLNEMQDELKHFASRLESMFDNDLKEL